MPKIKYPHVNFKPGDKQFFPGEKNKGNMQAAFYRHAVRHNWRIRTQVENGGLWLERLERTE